MVFDDQRRAGTESDRGAKDGSFGSGLVSHMGDQWIWGRHVNCSDHLSVSGLGQMGKTSTGQALGREV